MKTLITLLMISMSASAAFAQGNCAKLKVQERKITQVTRTIKTQNAIINQALNSIQTKNYYVTGSHVAIGLGSISTAIGLAEYSFLEQLRVGSVIGKPLMAAGAIVAVAGGIVLYVQLSDLKELNQSLEKKRAELAAQAEELTGAKASLELLKSLYPNCN